MAGKFVARRIKPALQRAREKQLLEVLSESGAYLRGLWSRLNGGGGRSRRALPPELELPPSTRKAVEKVRPRWHAAWRLLSPAAAAAVDADSGSSCSRMLAARSPLQA